MDITVGFEKSDIINRNWQGANTYTFHISSPLT